MSQPSPRSRHLCLLLIFLSTASVAAQAQWWRWIWPKPPSKTFYVRLDGNNSNDGQANEAGRAWRTIDWAADHVTPGSVVRIQAGTYVEVASPGVSGTAGTPLTLVADGAVTTCGMTFSARSYIRVIGFTLDASTTGCIHDVNIVAITGTNTGLEFWNNTAQNTNANAFFIAAAARCNSCIILGGSIKNIHLRAGGCFNGLALAGDDTFVGYIEFSTICYAGVVPAGHRLRMVNLNFSGFLQEGTAHPDFYYFQGGNTFGYSNNLIESIYGIGTITSTDNKAFHAQNQTTVPWNDNVWRLSTIYNMGSGFLSMYDTTGALNRWHFYHNTIVSCERANNDSSQTACGNISAQNGNGVSASIYNNIFYQAWADVVTTNIAVWSENLGSPVVTKDYNLAYDPDGSVTFQAHWNGQAHEQSNINPSFVNASADFTLQSGSGARGVGGPLTTASGSGSSSTSLTVASNTGSVFIGDNSGNLPQYGGALVPGDVITVGSTTVHVASVSGDTLTLASPISWTTGDPVYFGSSSTIDIGAYPYKAGGYVLSASYAIAGGVATITPNDATLVRFVVCYGDGVPYAIDNSSPYTCAVPAGTFSATVYPRYPSPTLWVVATP